MTQVDIRITDEFNEPADQFAFYDAIPLVQRTQLRKQKHTNIRSFVGDVNLVALAARPVYMLFLDSLNMDRLSGISMTELDAFVTVREGENWTLGTAAKDVTRRNWWILSVDCPVGHTTITSSTVLR